MQNRVHYNVVCQEATKCSPGLILGEGAFAEAVDIHWKIETALLQLSGEKEAKLFSGKAGSAIC